MIQKPTIIITSLGRTGTRFFSTLFDGIISDGTALHEPDILNVGQGKGKEIIRQIQESGIHNFIIRKALGQWSLVKISDGRVTKKLNYEESVKKTLNQRQQFVESKSGQVYIESNLGYYGLIDVLKDVYKHHRVIYVIRSPYDWIRSVMSWGTMYNKGKIRGKVAHTWPTAFDFASDPYKLKWESMSRFERVCWSWGKLNEYAVNSVSQNVNAKVFRFEDIFKSDNRYEYLMELVQFATDIPNVSPIIVDSLDGWLNKQIHQSKDQFPPWENWSREEKQHFQAVCGTLINKFNY